MTASKIARAAAGALLALPLLVGAQWIGMPTAAPAAPPPPEHQATPDPNAPATGSVHGALRGPAAVKAAADAADTFRTLRTHMGDTGVAPHRRHPESAPTHLWWGTFTQAGSTNGEMATQRVVPELSISGPGDVVYAPTMKPAGGSCIEVVTAYTNRLDNAIWAWDWCGSGGPAVVLPIDSDFMSTYTTSVNGHPAYTVRELRTDASANTWTASLYNYQTDSWDELFTSSGTDESGQSRGWNMFEIYATRDPSTGNGYYCADASGDAFESSNIQVRTASGWVPTTPANSVLRPTTNPDPSDYLCPSLEFQLPSANDHWIVQN